jgi:hypothetical protein
LEKNMHNPTEPTGELTIGDKTYTLLFDFEAIAAAEDATGISLIAGLHEKDVNSPRISQVRALLWACLLPKQPKITRTEAASWVNRHNLNHIWGKVLQVWVDGMAEPEAAGSEDPPAGQS